MAFCQQLVLNALMKDYCSAVIGADRRSSGLCCAVLTAAPQHHLQPCCPLRLCTPVLSHLMLYPQDGDGDRAIEALRLEETSRISKPNTTHPTVPTARAPQCHIPVVLEYLQGR